MNPIVGGQFYMLSKWATWFINAIKPSQIQRAFHTTTSLYIQVIDQNHCQLTISYPCFRHSLTHSIKVKGSMWPSVMDNLRILLNRAQSLTQCATEQIVYRCYAVLPSLMHSIPFSITAFQVLTLLTQCALEMLELDELYTCTGWLHGSKQRPCKDIQSVAIKRQSWVANQCSQAF